MRGGSGWCGSHAKPSSRAGTRACRRSRSRGVASIAGGGVDWGTALLFHEQPVSTASLHRLLASRPRAVSMIIGPEGGLSGGEVELLCATGFQLVHLGGNVLRVETAALYALGAVKTILQERDEWTPVQ